MRAMLMNDLGPVSESSVPLIAADWPDPTPAGGEILIRVSVCGVCHTELDEIEGRTAAARLPSSPAIRSSDGSKPWAKGPTYSGAATAWGWPGSIRRASAVHFCRRREENLCESFRATGRDAMAVTPS